ncbi:MAG: hypothetical protein HYY85_16815 [Deltaproteobacteria bacterium]|nr:hypothetical protein [Deltaproteobacteria bacterium]
MRDGLWILVGLLLAVAGGAWANEGAAAPGGSEKTPGKAEQVKTGERLVWGEVTAVDTEAGALVMEAVVGQGTITVGVVVEQDTVIKAPPDNRLRDIKVGDTVLMRYLRTEHRLIAKSIEVRPSRSRRAGARR